ncbi:DUF2087 domain-containing protein [Clostridium culturomicium]|uniref:DUF2087 domain-containing protein n=1 Tax=Clostridium culturomicium TaxID=1499683 RepID=UPI00058DF27F|nr:DUF2087 domain-containing protein [Clostridium culturomicium]
MENNLELFWDASIDEIKAGYTESSDAYICLVCGKEFIKGEVFPIENRFFDAKKAVELHIEEAHTSMLNYILNMNSSFIGISDVQKNLITHFASKETDKEIAAKLGIAGSTIRNHRYKLREKEKQSKVFLAMMELLAENTKKKISVLEKSTLCDAHKTATTLDDRFNITDKEKAQVIANYMDESGALKTYPSKEKKKIIVLEEIAKNFSKGKHYSEKEINRIIKRIHEDYATIRRALIEYGFLDRNNTGTDYWVND